MQVYVLFENNSILPLEDDSRLLTRKDVPLAIVTGKSPMDETASFNGQRFDFVFTPLYKNKEHELVENDIKEIPTSQYRALNLNYGIIDEKLAKAFGQAATNGTGLEGQIVYVTMEQEKSSVDSHLPLLPLKVFLDREERDSTSIPVTVFANIEDFFIHQSRVQREARIQQESQKKVNLRPETRKVLGLDN